MHRCVALKPRGGRALLCEPKINPAPGAEDVWGNADRTFGRGSFSLLLNRAAYYHILIKQALPPLPAACSGRYATTFFPTESVHISWGESCWLNCIFIWENFVTATMLSPSLRFCYVALNPDSFIRPEVIFSSSSKHIPELAFYTVSIEWALLRAPIFRCSQ